MLHLKLSTTVQDGSNNKTNIANYYYKFEAIDLNIVEQFVNCYLNAVGKGRFFIRYNSTTYQPIERHLHYHIKYKHRSCYQIYFIYGHASTAEIKIFCKLKVINMFMACKLWHTFYCFLFGQKFFWQKMHWWLSFNTKS